MAEAQDLVQRLLTSQNSDGGWSYQKGTSWAEPTALSVLALQSIKDSSNQSSIQRGISWLISQQRSSGGWAPTAAVDECTSVTSLVTLAILRDALIALEKALDWTARQVYRNDLSLGLMLAKFFDLPPAHAPGSVPWYPGTAGWVMPTSFSVLALSRAARERDQPRLLALAQQSCSYLFGRRCIDNGWNHGGSKTRSEDASSYPETTGLALLALRAAEVVAPSPGVARTAICRNSAIERRVVLDTDGAWFI